MPIAVAELGRAAGTRLVADARESAAADNTFPASEMATVERFWDDLAAARPEAFVGPVDCCSTVGLAYRYVRRRQPQQLGRVDLSVAERATLRRTRSVLREWSGLERWGGFSHVSFADDCIPLVATVAARNGYSGGFAFTWHRGLGNTALYPAARIRQYRDADPACLIGVMLHEEAHLAAARGVPWCDGEALATAVFEAGAEIVGYTAVLLAVDATTTLGDLENYLDDWGIEDARAFIATLDRGDLASVIRAVSLLAVAAARGQRALAVAARSVVPQPDPLRVLERALAS